MFDYQENSVSRKIISSEVLRRTPTETQLQWLYFDSTEINSIFF